MGKTTFSDPLLPVDLAELGGTCSITAFAGGGQSAPNNEVGGTIGEGTFGGSAMLGPKALGKPPGDGPAAREMFGSPFVICPVFGSMVPNGLPCKPDEEALEDGPGKAFNGNGGGDGAGGLPEAGGSVGWPALPPAFGKTS